MELYGAAAYFDCQAGVFIYNGKINDDTIKIAQKLNIEMIYLDLKDVEVEIPENEQIIDEEYSFRNVWMNYVKPLAFRKISNGMGLTYEIGNVTDGYIEIYSQQHKKHRIKIDEFKWIVDRINIIMKHIL